MTDLKWIREKLEVFENNHKHEQLTLKQEMDRRAIRENFWRGIETMDTNKILFTEWEGCFYVLTGRKMTEEEYALFSDWIDKVTKKTNVSVYDNLKVWFDSMNIEMLPKINTKRFDTEYEIEQRVLKIIQRIEDKKNEYRN